MPDTCKPVAAVLATVLFMGIALSGCVTSSIRADESDSEFSIEPLTDDPGAAQALAQVRLQLEHKPTDAFTAGLAMQELARYVDNSPTVARFYIDERLSSRAPPEQAGDGGNYNRYMDSRALTTLIKSGALEYGQAYWTRLRHQPAGYSWFRERFALRFSDFAAKSHPHDQLGAYYQLELLRYYEAHCESSLIGALHCGLRADLVRHYFVEYLANPTVDIGSKVEEAGDVAAARFDQADYPSAAGWYEVQVQLADLNPSSLSTIDEERDFDRLFWHSGMPVARAMELAAVRARSRYSAQMEQAAHRLQLIRDAGIESIPALDRPSTK